jgi:hypothetical protein
MMEECQIDRAHQVQHDESMSLTRNSEVYDVELQTTTTITGLNLGDQAKGKSNVLLHPLDAFLVDVIQKYDLQTLIISVSSASTMQNRGFPVGTAMRFRSRNNDSSESPNSQLHRNEEMEQVKPKGDRKIGYELMKLLTHKSIMCESVQLEPYYSNGKLKATHLGDGSKIIMLPNDAYALCHSKALHDQVIFAAPCRSTFGVYSQLQTNLNRMDILDKSSWMELKVLENGQIQIQRGLRLSRVILKRSDDHVNLDEVLGGSKGDWMYHCPLAKNSSFNVHEKHGILSHYDFKNQPLNMKRMFQVKDSEGNSVRIQRSNVRLNGISNKGKLMTRVYVGASKQGNSKCENGGHLKVNVVEIYPSFISPIYHSTKIFLVKGSGAGHGKCQY